MRTRFRFGPCLRLLVLLVLALLADRQWATAQAIERTIFATVQDQDRQPVQAVGPRDVRVREDGVEREVLRVLPATEPMQIAVLVDNSAAAQSDISNIRRALETFVARLAGEHQVALVGIADRPTVITEATSSAATLQQGIGRLFAQTNSGAYLLDALVETSAGFQKRRPERPVIVSIATEGVEFSNTFHQPVLEALRASGAPYYALVLQTARAPQTDEVRNRDIVWDQGTRDTGGERRTLLSSMGLETELLALADELLNQVKVTYARPQTLIPPERVTIDAARPGLTVRGALAPASKGA
jgi:hypothetical protein